MSLHFGGFMQVHSVLFTGGIDSTYRLCQLAGDENAVIQPVYIVFPVRHELQKELASQDRILEYIASNPNTKAKLLPIKRIGQKDIPKDQRILDLEDELERYRFGWQYLYIALLARWQQGLELCHETLPDEFLNGKVAFKETDGCRYIDADKTAPFLVPMFENVTWPILGTTRSQMVKDLKKWGYEKVWDMIWFCYESIDGKPCGICDNCRMKIKEGLTFLFSKKAIHRYLVYFFIYDCLPDYTRALYKQYVHKKEITAGIEELRWLKRFPRIEALRDTKLKNMILNGSSDFNDNEHQRRNKILSYRSDLERKKRLQEIFKKL